MADRVKLDLAWLLRACDSDSDVAALVWSAKLEPVAGPGAPIRPAVYAGRGDNDPPRRSEGERWKSPDDEKPTAIVVIDSIASQANRAELALLAQADALGLPLAVLDLTDRRLPSHLLRHVSSWEWPHRVADASLIHSMLDGKPTYETHWGRSLLDATVLEAGPLVSWFPQALAYGFWQSHQGTRRSQARAARAWHSEIIGWDPTDIDRQELTTKGDPMSLSAEASVKVMSSDTDHFRPLELREGKPSKKQKLSALGFGMVPGESLAMVSCPEISRTAVLSLAILRRIRLGGDAMAEAETAARAVIAALAIHGHALSDTAGMRSGCDLIVTEERLTARQRGADTPMVESESAVLLTDAVAHARSVGVDMSGWGSEPKRLTPSDGFNRIIAACWPDPDEGGR